MVSKKVLGPALAGTGAVGASGALAWALGLFDEEGLGDVIEVEEKKDVAVEAEPKLQENVPSDTADRADPGKQSAKEVQNRQASAAGNGTQRGGGSPARVIKRTGGEYFTSGKGASESDKKAVDSDSTLEVKWNDGMHSIMVKAEKEDEEDFSWSCRLKAIPIEDEINSGEHEFEEFKRQKEELEAALKNDDDKKQLVANCSRSLKEGEKQQGNDGIIELETERIKWNRYKFKEKENYFKRLWTEDFTGIDKLSNGDKELVEITDGWNIEETKDGGGKTGKVKISLKNKNWNCYISGDYGGDLKTKTFKKEGLEEILKLNKSDKSKSERKKYILRNCAKNQKNIKGLTIQDAGNNKWEFKDLVKIIEGMYENPTET